MRNLSELFGSLRRLLDRFLKNHHDYFPCYLPPSIGRFASWLLAFLYSGIEINAEDKEFLKSLGPDKIVAYATKYRSNFEVLFFHSRFRKEKLPYPLLGLDNRIWLWQPVSRALRIVLAWLDHLIRFRKKPNPYDSGFVEKEILSGTVSLVSMVDRKAFYRRYVKAKSDPLVHLLQAQQKTDREILVIPQLVLYGTRPPKSRKTVMQNVFGTEELPGRLRRLLSLVKFPETALVEATEPISLREFMKAREADHPSLQFLAYELRLEVTDRINRLRQSIVGPILVNREELRQKVLQSESFLKYIKELALSSDRSVYEFQAEAASYLDEIAAKYSSRTIDLLGMAVGWLTRTMFDGVEMDLKGLRRLKAMSQKGPVILMPCHKSHIDYLILSYMLYLNHMPCPLIAAGKNLSFFPMGTIFRNSGAFFIRRSFKGLPLYTQVFSEYIRALLETGFNIEFFLEGGRSRTGKLVLPKFGLLSIILEAYAQGACKDLHFQPIFIGYDRVLEEGSYIRELEGGEKQEENLSQMVKARKFLKKRFGRIFVEFNEPIRAEDFLARFEVPYAKMNDQEKGVVVRNLGHRVTHAIDQVTVATPHSLVAAAALTAGGRSFSEEEILTTVNFYLTHLKMNNAKLSDTLMDPVAGVRQTLDAYVKDKFLVRYEEKTEAPEPEPRIRYTVAENRRPLLEYYKNNAMGFFIPEAFTALSILAQEAFEFSATDLHTSYKALQDLFKNEFHYDVDLPPEHFVRKSLKMFIDDTMIIPHAALPDRYNITAAGFKKLGYLASLLRNFFESYLIALRVFSRESMEGLGRKERAKKFRSMGAAMYKSGEVVLKESLSKVNFDNACDYFLSRNIRGPVDGPDIELYTAVIQNYLNRMP